VKRRALVTSVQYGGIGGAVMRIYKYIYQTTIYIDTTIHFQLE